MFYAFSQKTDQLAIEWAPYSLPAGFAALGVLFGFLSVLVFIKRKTIVCFVNGFFKKNIITPVMMYVLCGCLVVSACGVILLSGQPSQVIEWRVHSNGLSVKSLNKNVFVPWSDMLSVRLDERVKELSKASLVFTTADQKEVWLILRWLKKRHRFRLLKELSKHIPRQIKPILKNKKYMYSLL